MDEVIKRRRHAQTASLPGNCMVSTLPWSFRVTKCMCSHCDLYLCTSCQLSHEVEESR